MNVVMNVRISYKMLFLLYTYMCMQAHAYIDHVYVDL